MNVIWITSDSFRRDHLGAYGNKKIQTPSLDTLAAKSVQFQRHYAAGFPTMPTRADHFTGRWTMSFMGWSPLPSNVTTLAEILSQKGLHTAAVVDTPFYLRDGMNYDRGFKSFFMNIGQEGSGAKKLKAGWHESQDTRAAWRFESDYNAPQTFTKAMRWLENHYKEDFFLYIDTWDPHEPWDAPAYYTEIYCPDYDGEIIEPVYGYWPDVPGYKKKGLKKRMQLIVVRSPWWTPGWVIFCDGLKTWALWTIQLSSSLRTTASTSVNTAGSSGRWFMKLGRMENTLRWMTGISRLMAEYGPIRLFTKRL